MALTILRGPIDVPIEPLQSRTVAVIGFGNQGHAHALNLRDSGVETVVGVRKDSPSGERAAELGFEVREISTAVSASDLAVLALPDEVQPDVFSRDIRPALRDGATVGFLHGFAIYHQLIAPPETVGVVMVAPKGPGTTLRRRFEDGRGIPCVLAVHQDPIGEAEQMALAWAAGIGCGRAGVLRATFAQETVTDLFGEQAVLCGGLGQLIVAAFETLTAAGYPPELAYLECCQEVGQVADLIYERGLTGMSEAISNTAEFGAADAGPRLIGAPVRAMMDHLLREIEDGTFARRMNDDAASGFRWFQRQRDGQRHHPIEAAGAIIRDLMQGSEPAHGQQPQPSSNRIEPTTPP